MATDVESLLIRLDATSESLRREMRRAEQSVGNSSKRMEREIRRVDQSMDRLNKMAATLRRGLGALGVGLSIQGIRSMADNALNAASALQTTADRVALNVETLQELRSAAAEVNVQQNQLDMGMQRFTRRLAEAAQGGGVLKDVLEQYNIAVRDANGSMRSSEDVLRDLADAIQNAESDAERLRIAFKAFDSEGAALVNLLRQGGKGLDEARQRARELGHVLGRDLVNAGASAQTQLDNLFQTIRTQINQGLLETLVSDMGDLSEIAKDPQFQSGLRAIGQGIGAIGQAVSAAIGQLGSFVQLLRDPSWQNLGNLLSGSALGLAAGVAEQFLGGDKGVARAQQLSELSARIAETRETIAALERSSIPNAEVRLEQERETLAVLEQQRNEILGALDGTAEGLMGVDVVLGTISVTATNTATTIDKAAKKLADAWAKQYADLQATNEAMVVLIAAYGEGAIAAGKAQREFELFGKIQGINTDYTEAQRAALVALMREQQDYAAQIEHLQRIQDLDGQLELLQAELRLVGETKAVREEALAVLEAEIRLKQRGVDLSSQQAREELKRVRQMAQTRRAIDEQTQALAEQGRAFQSLVDDSVRYGSDLFADLFRETSGGWRDMWENMRQTMVSMLARMAAEAALRPIVISVLGAMGVAGAGAAAGAAGVGGGGGILGTLFGMGQQAASLGGAGGLFAGGGALAGVGSFMSKPLFMVPTGAIEAGTGAMAMAPGISLGGVLGAAGLGFMGGSMLAQLTSGNQMMGGLGGAGGAALGAAIGSAIPGIGTVLGGIAGGLLGGGIGSLFGGGGNTDQQIRPYSHALGTGRGVQTPFREFRNSAHRFDGSALEQAVVQADHAIAAALSDRAIEQVREYFDLAGTIKGKKRDNKELGPKHFARFIRDSMDDVILALGGQAAAAGYRSAVSGASPEQALEMAQKFAIFLGGLADETLFKPQEISEIEAAWKALDAQADEFRSMAEQLGQSVAEVERQFREAQQAFRDEIQQGYQDQIDAMLRPAELAWRQLREAQTKEIKELEKIGVSTERARQLHALQIRALFEQNYELQRQYLEGLIDLGDDLNAQLGALWGVVTTGIDGLIQGSNAAYQEAVRLGRQYAQINRSLQQTVADLRTGPQSPLSLEQQLMEALDRFRQTLGEALGGDSEAAQQLQQLVNPVLDLASQFFGRTEGYAQIFDEVLRGLEMAGVAMETQAGGFAALASALEAQIDILNEINDVLNRRDELGEDFESRYNKLTSELEDVGYTIGGINAFLRDAADAIPTLIVTSFASGLDSAQLAKRMGELFQATVTATEQAMRDGVENIGAAIDGAQQALLRGWIPDFIELAEQFNGTIPEIRFDRVTARVVAHYEASADQLGEGLESAVAQVQFDGLQQAIYTVQRLVGERFDAAVGGISFEGINGEHLSAVLYDGITGIAQAAYVSLIGQAERIEGIINSTLESFTLDAARATITDSVDIINRGATRVQLAFGRVEGALLRLSNNADGHIVALIDEVDTAIARFTNWGTGSLRVGVESLRTQLLDVRNAGEGALLLWADTVEAREARISNLGAGNLVARINDLRADLLSIRNAGQGRLVFWAKQAEARRTTIENLDASNLVARIQDLRADLLAIRNTGQGRLLFWADTVEARRTTIENLDEGLLITRIGNLRSALLTIRNTGQGRLAFWADEVDAQRVRIEDLGAHPLLVQINNLRAGLVDVRAAGQARLASWRDAVEGHRAEINGIGIGDINANGNELRTRLTNVRNVSQDKLAGWRNRVYSHLERIREIDAGNISTNANQLRGALASTRNSVQNRLEGWMKRVQNGLNAITNISNDLGGGAIAAELKKIVQNRLPQRFKEAIDRAFKDVFGTTKPATFFKDMDKLVGANSELVTSLRELSRTMLLLARKDQIDAFASSIGARADKAIRVSSLSGARGKLNADQGWENQGHSYARINYSASEGFTMGATHKSGGSGSSQLNKMKDRAQELMDQLNHLVSVNRIAIDPSKLPSTLELNSRKGSASAQQIFDDLIKRGAVVTRVDDPQDNMLKRLATEMHRLTSGTLPKYGANYRVKNGKLEMDLWAGDRSLTRTGSQLTDLNDIAGQFLQMLKYEIKVSSAIEPLLRAIDFRPAGLGPQGGLEQLARSLMEHGLGTSNVPKFAAGGYHAGGLAIVGEQGPELVDFASPSRIYSAPDTSRILAGFANDNGSFRELIAEVRALRAENAELRRTVSEGFGDTVQAEGQSGLALRTELRALREDVEDLQSAVRQQARRQAS